MYIHIQTPDFIIVRASDLGEIKAVTALAKVFTSQWFAREWDGRYAEVARKEDNIITIVTI